MINDKFKYAKHGTLGVQGKKSRTTERIAVGFLMVAAILAAAALWYTSWPKEAKGETTITAPDQLLDAPKMVGTVSWYDYRLSGYPNYSKNHATAASRDYPKGTNLLVCRTNMTDVCITVRVNDWVENPKVVLDLSSYAFQQLAPLESGLVDVSVRAIK